LSPNILEETELLRRPRILGKLVDEVGAGGVIVVVVVIFAGAEAVNAKLVFVLFNKSLLLTTEDSAAPG
jgi:hypothetical protein